MTIWKSGKYEVECLICGKVHNKTYGYVLQVKDGDSWKTLTHATNKNWAHSMCRQLGEGYRVFNTYTLEESHARP